MANPDVIIDRGLSVLQQDPRWDKGKLTTYVSGLIVAAQLGRPPERIAFSISTEANRSGYLWDDTLQNFVKV